MAMSYNNVHVTTKKVEVNIREPKWKNVTIFINHIDYFKNISTKGVHNFILRLLFV